jgi:molybdate transport system substrate-binding protein
VRRVWGAIWLLAGLFASARATADEVQVAVAANFAVPMRRIADDFAKQTGHHASLAVGATGTFYAQVENGAPFEVLLAADEATPQKLEERGLAVPGSRFVYARGKLVLWSPKAGYVDGAGAVLHVGSFEHLAVANPKLAPYGAAAMETLGALGLLERLRPKLLFGESIAQTQQFVATANAELGFVALSQVIASSAPPSGSYWIVPQSLYAPIVQDAVLLQKGADHKAARALCEYLKSPAAKDVIRSFGYGAP